MKYLARNPWPFQGAIVESTEDIEGTALMTAFHRCGGCIFRSTGPM